ncbi:RTG3 Retrograde regulation protein 3 [Candida maltosa Xu316]
MGDFLNDSPADFTSTSNSNNTNNNTDSGTPNFTYNTNNFNYDNSQQQRQQLNLNFDSANDSNQNDFSLDLNFSGYSGVANSNSNVNNSNNSVNASNSGYNSNSHLASGQDYLSPMAFTSYNVPSDTNTFAGGSNPGSFTNEPFLDDVAFSQTILGPQLHLQNSNSSPQPVSPNQQGQHFVNPANNSANLDELISPQNNEESAYLNPQFFSPSNRGNNFSALTAIAEDHNSNLALSPDYRRQSISGNSNTNFPDVQTGSYLSPQFNPSFASPGYDAGSYLNSPPQYPPIEVENWNALSPPPQTTALSSSVPSSSANTISQDVPTKQLSKEEKIKRRREFHNAVERRRRDLIKERIKELGVIVPPSLLNPQLCAVQTLQRKSTIESTELNDLIGSIKVKETKPNKSTILNKSVDYINHLNYVLKQQDNARANLLQRIAYLENGGTGVKLEPGLGSQQQQQPTVNPNAEAGNYNPDDFFADIGTSTDNF